jgi:DNA-binding NarL/FixJ family response regulator
MTQKRIFLVDDHPMVREWLTTHIQHQTDLAICGEAADAASALQSILVAKPDVVIVDVSLPRRSGIELIQDLKQVQPDAAVIVLSMHDEMLYAERVLRAGARGYIMKRETTEKIITAIREVLAGNLYVSDRMKARLAEKFVGGAPSVRESPLGLLSNRELEVFQLLGQGRDTKQIAEDLGVNFKTVHADCARIKEKLKLTRASELLREAVRWEEQRHRT